MDGDGVDNPDLFAKTTAGQVLPDEVASVSCNGEIYSRSGIDGEFFNDKNHRLKIYTGTQITIGELRTSDEMRELQENLAEQLTAYK